MSSRLLFSAVLVLIRVAGVSAQDAPGRSWERTLEDEPQLIRLVEGLKTVLEAGDAELLSSQFRDGKIVLVMRNPPLPAALYAHSQAKALLGELLRHRPDLSLRVGLVRHEAGDDCAHVALDSPSGQGGGDRGHWKRFVAVYRRDAAGWKLSELKCP